MTPRTILSAARDRAGRTRSAHAAQRSPLTLRRPALLLAAAACGALTVSAFSAGPPAAQAGSPHAVSVAGKLGLSSSTSTVPDLRSLQDLSANRSQRAEAPGTADLAQSSADQKTLQALAAAADTQARILAQQQAEAAAKAAADAAAKAAADAAAKAAAEAAAAASATPSSFQDYALQKVGGDQSQFSCLQSLWGKESGWNPNAQNPSSTAYGIPQLLDSTWAGTGIAKTSNGFRQIDAGLVYINGRYGSPCGAWSHSRAYNWY